MGAYGGDIQGGLGIAKGPSGIAAMPQDGWAKAQAAQVQQAQNLQPQAESLFSRLVASAEQVQQVVAALDERLAQLLTRAVGPVPVADASGQTAPSPAGHLGALDLRLTQIMRHLQRAHVSLNHLEKVM